VVLDDVQTRGSAKSPTQTADLEAIICDDVLGLAGPTTSIAAALLVTPIYVNDLPERFLDPERHPEWDGRRVSMLSAMPGRIDLWEEYRDRRKDGQRAGDKGKAATAYYKANRAAMDAGAVVTWPERKKPGEISGLQSAMNIWCDNPRGFKAEYQCKPEVDALSAGAKELVPAEIATRLSGVARGEVPRECSILTAGFDAGLDLNWYAVVAWTDSFGGSIVDYGSWPRQARDFFAATDARPKMRDIYPGLSDSQLVYRGLTDVTTDVLNRVYKHEQTGGDMRVGRALVDSGYETDAVYQFVRSSPYATTLYPSKGIGRTRTARGVSEWQPRPGERRGHFWRLTKAETGRGQMVQFDPDAWKTALFERLTVPLGGKMGLSLFGNVKSPPSHEMMAEHLAAEWSESIAVRGVVFDKWSKRPDRQDNHLLDCVVLAAVAASVSGLTWSASGVPVEPRKPKKKIDIEALYKQSQTR
jgi:hypothetical protein